MTKYRRVAFVGEAMIELTPQVDGSHLAGFKPAGDVLNTAVYFRRARGNGIAARFVTAIGKDSFSEKIFDLARDESLETSGIRRANTAHCGLYAVSTSEGGERSFSYWRSNSAARTLFVGEDDFVALKDCDVVLVTGITLAIISDVARQRLHDWIMTAKSHGLKLAFDSNYRPALWESRAKAQEWVDRFWQACDIAFPSADDEMELFGDGNIAQVLERFRGYGVETGALKAGMLGSYALDGSDRQFEVEPVLNVIDTTAAGDSYNAGFLAAHLNDATLPNSILAAHALAREVIQHPGAIIERQES